MRNANLQKTVAKHRCQRLLPTHYPFCAHPVADALRGDAPGVRARGRLPRRAAAALPADGLSR